MNQGISKKLIFLSFLFTNFIQPIKSADLQNTNKIDKKLFFQKRNFVKWHQKKSYSLLDSNNSKKIPLEKNFFEKNPEKFLVALSKNQEELIIQSDKQSEINDVIYAEGNVFVSFGGKLLRADNLIYDKLNKKINATGNISLVSGDQLFRASQLEYNFISKKGYLLDVKGNINTENFIDDLSSNFTLSDSEKLVSLIEFKKKEVINTPKKVQNWLFFTDKLTIDGNKWISKRATFSNDLLESKQVKLAIN